MKHLKTFEKSVSEYKNPESIFMKAIEDNDIKKVVEFLKSNIIDINKDIIYNRGHNNPLWTAINLGRIEIVKELIKYGADVNFKPYSACPLILLAAYNIPLHRKVLKADEMPGSEAMLILKELIKAGADWCIENEHGDTFFDCLDNNSKKEIIKEFPEKYERYEKEMTFRRDIKKYNL